MVLLWTLVMINRVNFLTKQLQAHDGTGRSHDAGVATSVPATAAKLDGRGGKRHPHMRTRHPVRTHCFFLTRTSYLMTVIRHVASKQGLEVKDKIQLYKDTGNFAFDHKDALRCTGFEYLNTISRSSGVITSSIVDGSEPFYASLLVDSPTNPNMQYARILIRSDAAGTTNTLI